MGRKYKSYTYEEYKRAMELLEKGYGLTETCRILGWPETKYHYCTTGEEENISLQWRNGWQSHLRN